MTKTRRLGLRPPSHMPVGFESRSFFRVWLSVFLKRCAVLPRTCSLLTDSLLSHRGRGKMAAILQTTFSNVPIFLYENCCILIQIALKFVPKRFNQQYVSIGSDNGLVSNRRHPFYLNQCWPLTYMCAT